MTLMILAGVWALAFGHITITQSLKMKGNEARIFGLAVILVAAYGLPHVNAFFAHYQPKFLAGNDAFRSAYELLIGAGVLYVTGWAMTQVVPLLKVPSITVSLKRQRA
jgi:hypothetical protein